MLLYIVNRMYKTCTENSINNAMTWGYIVMYIERYVQDMYKTLLITLTVLTWILRGYSLPRYDHGHLPELRAIDCVKIRYDHKVFMLLM